MSDTPPRAGHLPRLMSREQAADYVGLSPSQFDLEVAAGTFPKPFPLRRTRRVLWDKQALDRIFDLRLTVGVELLEGSRDERKRKWHARHQRREDRPPDAGERGR
jgi:predicted DNA-binding transcriptional regulator AlpA